MEEGTIKSIALISAIISDNLSEEIMKHTGADYFTCLEICTDLALIVYKLLENDLASYGKVTYLDNIINKTKVVLDEQYNIRLFT